MPFVLPKFAVLLHLLLVVVYVACARAGADLPGHYLPLLLLIPALLEVTLLFPPQRRDETPLEARGRVSREVMRDPLFGLGLALMCYVAIQAINGPRALIFDVDVNRWLVSAPPADGLPSSMNRTEAARALYWVGTIWASLLAIRHGLSRKAGLRFLDALATISGLLALLGLAQYATGTSKAFWHLDMGRAFFATFNHAAQAGVFFAMMALASGGLLISSAATKSTRTRKWRVGIVMLLNALGASFTLIPGAILLAWIGLLVVLGYGLAYLLPKLESAGRVRLFSSVVIAIGILAFLNWVAYPENRVRQQLVSMLDGERAEPSMKTERRILRRAALAVWREHPFYGVGFGGLRHQIGRHLRDDDWEHLHSESPKTSHHDGLEFLCEFGLVGCSLLMGGIVLLLWPLYQRVRTALRRLQHPDNTRISVLHRLPPTFVATSAGLLGAVFLGAFYLPFHNLLVLLTWCLLLAILPTFFTVSRDTGSSRRSADGNHARRSRKLSA